LEPHRRLLTEVSALYLLTHLSPHTGVLLADGHIEPGHVHGLPAVVDALTHSLQPHLAALTRAFDHPPEYLDALPLIQTAGPPRGDADGGA
ncbi:acyl-CoA dehydrogenase, partial [Streptomyces sp. NPDC002491]